MNRLRSLLGPLRVFDAVHRAGGISRAAEMLHVTPGAVSQQIKLLESAMKVALVRRVGREVALTEAGLRLATRLSDLFDRIETVVDEVMDAGSPRRLRLKVLPSFAIKWLVPRLASFYVAHGDIDLEIATVGRAEELHLDKADFVVRHGAGDWTDVHVERLFDDAFVPVCVPALAQTLREPMDLCQSTLLHSMMRPESWSTWLRATGLGHAKAQRNVTLANAALCVQAAVDGLGVAIAQLAYVGEELASGRLVRPFDFVAPTELGYYLVCDLNKAHREPFCSFRQWVHSVR